MEHLDEENEEEVEPPPPPPPEPTVIESALKGDLEAVEAAILRGEPIEMQDAKGNTALILAAQVCKEHK